MNERRRIVGGAVAVAGAAVSMLLLAVVRERLVGENGVAPVTERKAVGEMELQTLHGGSWRLGNHRGEVVAINMWATWCGPCREETPMLVKVQRELGPKGFEVVGVSLDAGDREDKVRRFAEANGVDYEMGFPDAMSQMSAGLRAIPTTILVDRRGRVAKTYVGEIREGVLRRDVGELLGEGAG